MNSVDSNYYNKHDIGNREHARILITPTSREDLGERIVVLDSIIINLENYTLLALQNLRTGFSDCDYDIGQNPHLVSPEILLNENDIALSLAFGHKEAIGYNDLMAMTLLYVEQETVSKSRAIAVFKSLRTLLKEVI